MARVYQLEAPLAQEKVLALAAIFDASDLLDLGDQAAFCFLPSLDGEARGAGHSSSCNFLDTDPLVRRPSVGINST